MAAFSAAAIARRASSRRARRRRRDGMAQACVAYEKDMAVTVYPAAEGEDKEYDGGKIPMLAQHDTLR